MHKDMNGSKKLLMDAHAQTSVYESSYTRMYIATCVEIYTDIHKYTRKVDCRISFYVAELLFALRRLFQVRTGLVAEPRRATTLRASEQHPMLWSLAVAARKLKHRNRRTPLQRAYAYIHKKSDVYTCLSIHRCTYMHIHLCMHLKKQGSQQT